MKEWGAFEPIGCYEIFDRYGASADIGWVMGSCDVIPLGWFGYFPYRAYPGNNVSF